MTAIQKVTHSIVKTNNVIKMNDMEIFVNKESSSMIKKRLRTYLTW